MLDLRELKRRIDYWFDRIKYYNDESYLEKKKVLEELENLQLLLKAKTYLQEIRDAANEEL